MAAKTKTGMFNFKFFKDDYFILPAFSALLLALSRYPVKLNFLVFFAFIPLLYLINNPRKYYATATNSKIVKAALTFSTIYTLIALYWIAVVTIPGFFVLFLLFGFYFCILFFVIFKVSMTLPKINYLILVSSWVSFEWLQSLGELRFPWFNAGYALAEYKSLIQIAEFGGVYLLSIMILIVNVLFYSALKTFPNKSFVRRTVIVSAVIAVWFFSGYYRYKTIELEEKDISVSIVQVSIPQYIKWTETFYDSTLTLYSEYTLLAAEKEPDLIIWPEAAIPRCVINSGNASSFVADLARTADTDIFLGFPHCEFSEDYEERLYYNSATLFRRNGHIAPLYYKNILVPVGERMPFMSFLPFMRGFDFGQANWEYGTEPAFYDLEKNDETFTYSPLICFEIAFPAFIGRISRSEVDFFVNITNDAWFKKTVGPYQHAMMTVIRAVETRTQFFRAANTGISMVVDPKGNIRKKTALYEKTSISDSLLVYNKKAAFVSLWLNYPAALLILTICLTILAFLSLFSVKKSN